MAADAVVGRTGQRLAGLEQPRQRSYPQTNLKCQSQTTLEQKRSAADQHQTRREDQRQKMGQALQLVAVGQVSHRSVVFVADAAEQPAVVVPEPVAAPHMLGSRCMQVE